MTAVWIVAGAVVWLASALYGRRRGYVYGYEEARRRYRVLGERVWLSEARLQGAFYAAGGPLWLVLGPLLALFCWATPTPPSVEADRREAELREREKRIRDLEREAGL